MAQSVERRLGKAEVTGSSPVSSFAFYLYGDVAQLGEHLPCKQGVESSNLFVSIRRKAETCERACSSAG